MCVCVCKRVIHYCLCQTSVCGCTCVSPTNGLDMAQFGSCVLQFLLARNQPLMSHLVEVDDCEAVCLSGPHVLYTEEEPLSVLVCVEVKTKVKFIVPSTTGGGGGREGGMERGGGGGGGEAWKEGDIPVTHHPHTPSPSYITPTLPSYITLTHHHSHLHSLCEVATLKPRLKHQGCALRGKGGHGLWSHAGTSSGTSKLHKRCKPSTTLFTYYQRAPKAWVSARILSCDNSQTKSLGTTLGVGLTLVLWCSHISHVQVGWYRQRSCLPPHF